MTKVVIEQGEPVLRCDWYTDDVLSMDDSLTEDQVRKVMELIARTHDADIGINWEVIKQAIHIIKGESK